MPKVTVAIAVYNGAKFIQETLNSVLNQSFQDFEIIIINDGSNDQTESIINLFVDKRIKLINNGYNKGLIYSRNKYLQLANGEYIAILDSDDIWYPNKLKVQVEFMDANKEFGISGTFAVRNNTIWKYPIEHDDIKIRLIFGSAVIHSSAIIRKSYLKQFNITYRTQIAQDYDLFAQSVTYFKLYNIPKALIEYRVHKDQITNKNHKEQKTWSNTIGIEYLRNLGITNIEIPYISAYKKMLNFDYISINIKDLWHLKETFELITRSNLEFSFFNHDRLLQVLAERWFICCYHSSTGINGYFLYNKSTLSKSYPLTLKSKAKFIIKKIFHSIKQTKNKCFKYYGI